MRPATRVCCFLLQFSVIYMQLQNKGGFSDGSMVKNLPANVGDPDLILGSGRSPGEGNCYPLQYSYLGNPWTEECGGLQSIGWQRVRHNLVTKQQQQQREKGDD